VTYIDDRDDGETASGIVTDSIADLLGGRKVDFPDNARSARCRRPHHLTDYSRAAADSEVWSER